MKTAQEILSNKPMDLSDWDLRHIVDAMNEFASQFKPKWIPLTDEVIASFPDVKFLMVWCPERVMWFHMYRRMGEWVCTELGDHEIQHLKFTHYMECIEGPLPTKP